MATEPSFLDYLSRNSSPFGVRARSRSVAPGGSQFDFSKLTSSVNPTPADKAGDVLSSLVDILSRPLFAVTETVDSGLEGVEDGKRVAEKWQAGDGGGAVADLVGNIAKNVTAPVRGFFSTNRDDKRTTSELIEKVTDTAGKRFDPDYVDEQDNVNPWVKGIAGFAGDVALDPLTWVPGGAIAAVLKTGAKGAKALTAADDVARVADDVEEAVAAGTRQAETPKQFSDRAGLPAPTRFTAGKSGVLDRPGTPILNDQPKPRPGNYQVAWSNGGENTGIRYFDTIEEAQAEVKKFVDGGFKVNPALLKQSKTKKGVEGVVMSRLAPKAAAKTAPAPVAAPAVARIVVLGKSGARETKEFASIEEARVFIQKLQKQGIKSTNSKNPRLKEGELKYRIEKIEQAKAAVPKTTSPEAMRSVLDEIVSGSDELPAIPEALSPAAYRSEVLNQAAMDMALPPKIVRAASNITLNSNRKILSDAYIRYREDFAEAAAEGRAINILGDDITPAGATTALTRFAQKLARDEEGLEAVLGTPLLTQLRAVTNPDIFDVYMSTLMKVLDSRGALADASLLGPSSPALKMVQQMGMDPQDFLRQAFSKTDETTTEVAKAVDEGLAEPLPPVEDAIKELGKAKSDGTPLSLAEQDAAAVLPAVFRDNVVKPMQKSVYPTQSGRGVKRTEEEFGKGLGADVPFLNTYTQFDIAMKVILRVAKRVKDYRTPQGRPLGGIARAEKVREETMNTLAYIDNFLIKSKVPMHFDLLVDGVPDRLPMTFKQAIEALDELGPDMRKYTTMMFFNADTLVPPTKFMEAVVAAARGGDSAFDEVVEILSSAVKRNQKVDGKPMKNWFAGEAEGRFGNLPGPKQTAPADASRIVAKDKARYVMYDPQEILARVADGLTKSAVRLNEISVVNAAKYAEQLQSDTLMMTQETIESMMRLANAADNDMAAALRAVGKPEGLVEAVTAERAIREDAARIAEAMAKAAAPEGVQETAEAAIKQAEALRKQNPEYAARVAQKLYDVQANNDRAKLDAINAFRAKNGQKPLDATNDVPSSAYPDIPMSTVMDDSGDVLKVGSQADPWKKNLRRAEDGVYAGINTARLNFMDPLKRFFSPGYGLRGQIDLFHMKHKFGGVAHSLLVDKVYGVRALMKKHGRMVDSSGTTVFDQAFRAFQKNAQVTDPEMAEAIAGISKYMGDLLGTGGTAVKNSVLGNAFFRNNLLGVEYLNDMFKQYKILGDSFNYDGFDFFDIGLAKAQLDDLKKAGMPVEADLLGLAAEQWRTWDVKDPAEFIAKVNAAAIGAATDLGIAQSFVKSMREMGLSSAKPRPGFARIDVQGKTKYGQLVKLLSGSDQYFDVETLNGLKRLDDIARTTRGLDGEVGKFVSKYIDPTQNAWKFAITMPRPGHHVRNFFGDESMTYVAEGTQFWMRSSNDAFKIMSIRNNYDGVDLIRALNMAGETKLPGGTDILTKGRYGEFSIDDIYTIARAQGILPRARVIEDLYTDEIAQGGGAGYAKFMETVSLQNTKLGEVAGGISEYRDHYTRLKHFMQIVHKAQKDGGFKNKEELFEYAAKRVMKYHPDVTMLSTAEAKYARRIIPFYSWMRPATAALIEGMVLNPHRVNAFNKASYNLAVAMGVNPDSLYDPFPEDQLFPSFLTEQMEGPQFQVGDAYFRVNPGFAPWDIPNMLGPDPVRGIAGATTPLVRVPFEMLSGGAWGTGARINDQSDYLDASIPGVNYAANVTGISPTGSLVSLLQGRGIDPQFQVAAGNKGDADKALSAFNWLTGLGVQNFSKPNYINFAEIEKRNAEGDKGSAF